MRIIRVIVILGGLAIILPLPDAEDRQKLGLAAVPGPGATAGAVTAMTEATGLCEDFAQFCDLTGLAVMRLETKTSFTIALIRQLAFGPTTADRTPDGRAADPAHGPSTLILDDLVPPWRGPVPQR